MTPIVNGLEARFAEEVDFQLLDASLGEGKRLFDHYGNRGHPSYIDLPPLFGPLLMLDASPETASGQRSMSLALVVCRPGNCAA